ncbi:MAG TPA: helix-turn-helix transcriptional regulator [Cytophagaceae bacterium]|nr:helix-turn-helix transcriptional regulator [Cytophagaceae bacterium]
MITIGLFAMAVVLLIIGVLLYRTDSLIVVPYPAKSSIVIDTYHEEGPVFSETSCHRTDTGIEFNYILNKNFGEPFAAVYLRDTSEENPFFNASRYDILEVRLHSKKSKRIPITFTISKQLILGDDTIKAVPYGVVVDHYGNDTTYKLHLKDFKVPSWWLRYYKLAEKDLEAPDFSKIISFIVGSCQALGPDIPDTTFISNIRFVASNRKLLLVIGCWLCILVLIAAYLHLFRKKKSVASLQIAYTPLTIKDTHDDEFGKIVEFIAGNYSNSELSLTDVQNGIGINGKAISRLIKDNLQISFTDYLNQLRITEVKRLLKETKLPVSDIAYKVGYNNISHFNRVFKAITGTTPKGYREEE